MEMENAIEKPTQAMIRPRAPLRMILIPDILVAIQFILGMYINLYVEFPQTGPVDNWKYAVHTISVIAHIIVGTLILVLTVLSFVNSVRMKNSHQIKFSAVALTGVLLAAIGGVTFITTQIEMASYIMAIGFMTGLLAVNLGFITQ